MIRAVLIFLFFSKMPLFSLEWDFEKDADQILEQSVKSVFDSIQKNPSPNDLLPKEDKGKTFDGESAREDVLSQNIKPNPVVEFLEAHPVENSKISDVESWLFSGDVSIDPESGEFIETCTESSDSIPFNLVRSLEYDLEKKVVLEKVPVEKCLGHTKEEKVKKGTGKREKRKIEEKFASNPNIRWYSVQSEKKGIGHRDVVTSSWRHVNNSKQCNSKTNLLEVVEKEVEEVANERWKYNNDSIKEIAKNAHSSFLSKKCLDHSKKTIGGTDYSRCWVEQLSFLYNPPKVDGCKFLKSQFCRLKSSQCLKQGPFGCILWERKFHCHKKLTKKKAHQIDASDLGLDDPIWEVEYQPNKGFSDVVTKLEIFSEMEKEMENAQAIDIKNIEFFSGKKMRCYAHVLENVSYDCCEKMGGLAVDGLIAKCDEDEIALFDLRNRGQCHDVGSKDEKTAGIKTAKKRVFCCFSSKLARVFNEKSRDQLGIDWGDADHPMCGGFCQSQIAKINFDEIDLSEAFEEANIDMDERVERLKNKISHGLDLL